MGLYMRFKSFKGEKHFEMMRQSIAQFRGGYGKVVSGFHFTFWSETVQQASEISRGGKRSEM